MKEQKLLTDAQIARRKTVAICLIGLGVVLLPIIRIFFRSVIVRSALESEIVGRLMSINMIVGCVLAALIVAVGWLMVGKLLDKGRTDFVKHWIVAYLLYAISQGVLWYSLGYIIPFFIEDMAGQWLVQNVVCWLVIPIAIKIYMIWSVDSVRTNSADMAVCQMAIFVQAVLAVEIVGTSLTSVYSNLLNYYREDVVLFGGYFIQYLSWILPFALFFGMVKLIRSSLFASTPAQMAEFSGHSAPRMPFFNAPVGGAIASSILCMVLTVVLTLFWNDIYNAF